MGEHPIRAIMEEREKERFYSLEDFCGRFDRFVLSRNAIENLIYAGAFDFTKKTRREMLRNLPVIMERARAEREKEESRQIGLFDFAEDIKTEIPVYENNLREFDMTELRSHETDVCGMSFS
jgi:DNA polymerase III alpha subunit